MKQVLKNLIKSQIVAWLPNLLQNDEVMSKMSDVT